MELFIAIWCLRLALFGTLLVGAVSFATGSSPVESVNRALIAAVTFTLFGRLLIGWLEPTSDRIARQRLKRAPSSRPAPGSPPSVRAAARREMTRSASNR